MNTLFVQPLQRGTKIRDIAELFEPFGPVECVRIVIADLQPKFALVELPFQHSADKAIEKLNGKKVDRQVLEVVQLGSACLLRTPREAALDAPLE